METDDHGARRLRIFGLAVDGNGFLDVLTGRVRVVDFPADTELRRVSYDVYTDRILFLIESQSFDPIPKGQTIPEWQVMGQKES